MIKIERRVTDKAQKAVESLQKAKAKGASFAAFKRWLIRDHSDTYPDLVQFLGQL